MVPERKVIDECLVSTVETYPCLYNATLKDFKDVKTKDNACRLWRCLWDTAVCTLRALLTSCSLYAQRQVQRVRNDRLETELKQVQVYEQLQ